MSVPLRTALSAAAGVGAFSGLGSYYMFNKKEQPIIQETEHHDSRPFQLLSGEEIDQRLREAQHVTQPQVKGIRAVYTNQLPSNNPVEDNFSVNTFQHGLIAGVYDGHIGPQCSRLLKKQLPIYLARQLKSSSDPEEAISSAFVELDQDIQQRFYNLFPPSVAKTHEADIRQALARQPDQEATQKIIEEAIHGSCALTVYVKDGVVYSANTGDSRVVIVSQDEQGQWKGRRLVEEESPANPDWRSHMISQHPPEESETLVMRNRIFGLIAVGGSFGDIMYKVPVDYQMKVLPYIPFDIYKSFARYHYRIVAHYRTPPYLQSKPLVSRHTLEKGDRFIILGTDGLWDELSWDDCRSVEGDQVAANIMRQWKTTDDSNPATHLTRQALLHDAVYKNLRLKEPVQDPTLELSKRLTRKPSRSYRDDITITVIELDTEETAPELQNVGPLNPVQEIDPDVPRLFDSIQQAGQSWLGWFWSKL
ncbi:phosphatase 2C-like domain-containing protein [Sporodiniella umbellata]|nr:phosphatase 2C-like domain-containing protein [Sporodiniella umbellata]